MASSLNVGDNRKEMMRAELELEIRVLKRFDKRKVFRNLGEAYGRALLDERRKMEPGILGRKESV
jgi:hypothetical protein